MKKSLTMLTIAWMLTLDGSNYLLSWVGEILRALNVSAQSAPVLPYVGVALQILLYGVAILLAYLAKREKALMPLAVIAIAVNCLAAFNGIASMVYAVLTGQL